MVEFQPFDRENGCIKHIFVPKRAVIIDNSVMEHGREGLALFSGSHEAGHITMHWGVYTDMIMDGAESKTGSRGTRSKSIRTAADWREHQADYFAAAIAMPNATFPLFIVTYRFPTTNFISP